MMNWALLIAVVCLTATIVFMGITKFGNAHDDVTVVLYLLTGGITIVSFFKAAVFATSERAK